jgi:hypothetical protein
MRWNAVFAAGLSLFIACDAAERGRAAAKAEADAERQKAAAQVKPANRIKSPVAKGTRVPCTQLIDPAAFTNALGEIEPLTVRDSTGTMLDATASCTLIRGGERPDTKAQEALIKKTGRLGTLPGDPECIVTLYCWVVEDGEKFKERCTPSPDHPGSKTPDETATGGWACRDTSPQGAFDIDSFKFIDADSKCLVQINGGPSVTDNERIATCARTARETISAENLLPGAPARYTIEPPADSATTTPPQ